jgi:2,3-bisphosphoglycerate-dependent phosphoglycerate mutase
VPELMLVRHCEASGQAPEAPLTQVGSHQAEALAATLAEYPIDWVVSSPFRRARDTIGPLASARGFEVQIDSRLSERRLADPPVEDWRDYIRLSFENPDRRAPGGESGREALARAWVAIRFALESPQRLPVLVSHGHLMALVLDSIAPGFGYAGWESLRNPDVFLIAGTSGKLEFQRIDAAD